MEGFVLEADAVIDLHLHTVYSDGDWTAEALLDHLVTEQFALAAITDHDRVDTALSLQKIAAEKGFKLLIAAEMSANWRGEMVDVLGYGFNPTTQALQAAADKILKLQQENILHAAASIRQGGCALPADGVQAILDLPAVRQPFALIDLVQKQDLPDENRLLEESGLAIMNLEIAEVVEAIHQSGGLALIAHPGQGDGFLCFDEGLLDQLRAIVPIDGIEVYHSKHTPEQSAMFRAYAEHHHLLISAGSDSHRPNKPPIKYRAALCRDLLNRLGIQVQDG